MHDVEKDKNSPHSPGIVASNEELLRAIFYPDHVDEQNMLKPEAIPTQDLKERGYSVQRREYLVQEVLEKFLQDYIDRCDERKLNGITSLFCENVRSILDVQDTQAFIVLDDAEAPESEAHAIIKFANKQTPSKSKALRKKLLDEFGKLKSVSELYEVGC